MIRAEQQRGRDRQPQRPGGLEVDDEIELRRLLDGNVSFATHAEATPRLTQFFERLRTLGVARSDWSDMHIKQLSDTLAVAGIAVVRYGAEGQEIERVGWTYLLHNTPGGWRIAVLANHPSETVLQVN